MDAKMEKLNKLSQVLQQDKIALQTTIRNLTEPSTNSELDLIVSSSIGLEFPPE